MGDLGPGEARERFGTDLAMAQLRVTAAETVKEQAEMSYQAASGFLADAEATVDSATSDLAQVRTTVLSAVETAGEDALDRETLREIMAVRGRSADEIKDYFSHVDKIADGPQPIIIISSADEVSKFGLARVVYGQAGGALGSYAPHFSKKEGSKPGKRELTIPVHSARGFTLDDVTAGSVKVFAKKASDDMAYTSVHANHDLPFDRVHFAGSAQEVESTVGNILNADKRPFADHSTVRALSLPTMVAYGNEAVDALSAKIAKRDSLTAALAKRCMLGLGVTGSADELSNLELPTAVKGGLYMDFAHALDDLLARRGVDDVNLATAEETLAFLGPLQSAIGYQPETVMDSIRERISAVYSGSLRKVITGESFGPGADDVLESVIRPVRDLHELGVSAQGSAGDTVSRVAGEIREQALLRALNHTPRRSFLRRREIKAVLAANDPGC
ncbi:MAG TPA: hypothetical protein VFX86_01765 [Candidatus Saccharimonadales bacterium]|nr:hypothetical protein [Candidatus Saccharimonadales bacterium]